MDYVDSSIQDVLFSRYVKKAIKSNTAIDIPKWND